MVHELGKPEQSGVVETGDNIVHPIKHVGDVPLNPVGQKGLMLNVLYVPTIAKSLVSNTQIVDYGMQV